jgi:hypothetical protein
MTRVAAQLLVDCLAEQGCDRDAPGSALRGLNEGLRHVWLLEEMRPALVRMARSALIDAE